jgi:hypothetical protein
MTEKLKSCPFCEAKTLLKESLDVLIGKEELNYERTGGCSKDAQSIIKNIKEFLSQASEDCR